ncbi:hypothetical protein VNO78_21693 [Psophocarpus tetragonolobus]|uniref:Legume lectin domain-containing protein n=2 Tax=Psophocarpus tetragonolobus TaxID=3891 RepID=A0AAN9SDN7_PSOTE
MAAPKFPVAFISLTLFLLVLNKVNSTETQSFNFDHFEENSNELNLQRDASIKSSGVLELTKLTKNGNPVWKSTGRALYAEPIHVWDSTTGNVASFETRFSFNITQPYADPEPADGLAFFMVPPNSPQGEDGGNLGVFKPGGGLNAFAVEFDTFQNTWDPQVPHIGIDVNSIVSSKTLHFQLENGGVANVVIKYDSPTKILNVVLAFHSVGTVYTLSNIVDLKQEFPNSEWVNVGLSATTGYQKNAVETHEIISWSFTSSLQQTNNAIPTSNHNTFAS